MRRILLVMVLLAAAHLIHAAPVGAAPPVCDNVPGSESLGSDFDGDGNQDMAVGAPYERSGGAVQILYGGTDWPTRDVSIHQNTPGIPGNRDTGDYWSWSRAAGDFDGDGYCDLAVGSPNEDWPYASGRVHVLYGSPRGITADRVQVFTQDSPGVLGAREKFDRFGSSLVAANFGFGPEADLAIGSNGERVGRTNVAGQVNVLYGSARGLTADGNTVIHQDMLGAKDAAEEYDEFGGILAAGDLGGSTHADLVVGIPREDISGVENDGAVQVFHGSSRGVTMNDRLWHVGPSGIAGTNSERWGFFGQAVVVGNFGGSTSADLAIGAPGTTVDTVDDAGAVHVLYDAGEDATHQMITTTSGRNDFFGYRLAAADWGATEHADLAVGIPGAGEEIGAVEVFYGQDEGFAVPSLTARLSKAQPPVSQAWSSGGLEFFDRDGNGHADLAVGSTYDHMTEEHGHGTLMVFDGGVREGLGESGIVPVIHQDTPGVGGVTMRNDHWGWVGANSIPEPIGSGDDDV